MDLFETIEYRRSIRRFTAKPLPDGVIRKALDAAILAPNSSNAQTWDFYWVRSQAAKTKVVTACLDQSAARTASELVVITANSDKWRRSWPFLKTYVEEINAPGPVKMYYGKLFPWMYRSGPLNFLGLLKWIGFNLIGLFRPITRGPNTFADAQLVAIKSAALAAENFVLAITALGYASCMMEGFDERRLKKVLGLNRSTRVVMVIGVGEEAERGTWGPRFRIPTDQVVHEV